MKKCANCGRENDESAVHCSECGTGLTAAKAAPPNPEDSVPAPEPTKPKYQIRPLSPEEAKLDLVTIVSCPTLVDADMVVSELEAAGIKALIPDEFLAETWAYGLGSLGFVRVQVSPQDYDAAKDIIEDAERLAGKPAAPPSA
jgi:hypothetical protein